ncbi:hypothetical protein CMO96_01700 [Candidatus Woesebacteria bacterium]|nr:hypothetical protein [Candidatus Woesebacteria bacterium]|tara:strand:- start:177 stop:413 length:237 start_codon:yes stop_codon:yes gene_type:complete
MAARLTKADFELVIDSIDEAVGNFVKWYDEQYTSNPSSRAVELGIRRQLGKSFASRLKYTNDSFDGRRFEISVSKEIR